ncbi:MAG: alpha-1,6-glucosidase domain-containing protein, partial [Chloroflexus sp.]
MPYVEKHDNETLFDQNVFKLPNGDGSGNPGWIGSGIPTTAMSDRVRAQNVAQSIIALAQGVPFFQMGTDLLRSKSLDRNSYDSGDWFNRVYWDQSSNNFGVGLPPAWDNQSRWGIMSPLLANTALSPSSANIAFAAAQFREFLRIRYSSPLFRLSSATDIANRTTHYDTTGKPGLIVYALNDTVDPGLDPAYETILVFINANKIAQTYTLSGADGFTLHPVQADATDADPVVQTASFNDSTDTFTIPARTTAVFVSSNPIVPPSTLDWVGLMWPRGGVANAINEGAATGGFDVYVQVYEAGVTEGAGQGAGIACYLHWGKYGSTWNDIAMTYNTDKGNNDEYKATIPQ